METLPPLYRLPGIHEPFASLSHFAGALVFLVLGAVLLVRARSNPRGLPYLAVYAVSVVMLLIISGMFHMPVRGTPTHRIVERLDHSAIFILIAGSFTPVHGILFHGRERWWPLVLIWTASLIGLAVKTIFFDYLADWVGYAMYMGLGWCGFISGAVLARRYGLNFIKPLLIAGVAYSIGGFIDLVQTLVLIPGVIHAHEFFHVTVLMGIFWHWLFIWQFAPGEQTLRELAPQPAIEEAIQEAGL